MYKIPPQHTHTHTFQEVVGTMPMQRTEIYGAEELHKYYKVYETIGSGNV